MLETIREFAVERLDASEAARELRVRHAESFLALAVEAEEHVLRDSLEWLERLEAEHDNLRGALDHLVDSGDAASALRLAAALWRFWYLRNHFQEGFRRFESVLALGAEPTPERATVLRGASVMALNLGDTSAGIRYAELARQLDGALGNEWGVAYSTMMLGNSYSEASDATRDLVRARDYLAESESLFEAAGDSYYALIAMSNRAWIVGELGDPVEEKRLHEQSLALARQIGNAGIEANSLAQLAMAARDEGDLAGAVRLLRASLGIDHHRGMTMNVATNLGRLASVLARQGDQTRAATLLGAEEGLYERNGAGIPWWAKRRQEETLALIRDHLDPGAVGEALMVGRTMSVDDAVVLAFAAPDPT
jgi:non-specific serine/threonine protein kinase